MRLALILSFVFAAAALAPPVAAQAIPGSPIPVTKPQGVSSSSIQPGQQGVSSSSIQSGQSIVPVVATPRVDSAAIRGAPQQPTPGGAGVVPRETPPPVPPTATPIPPLSVQSPPRVALQSTPSVFRPDEAFVRSSPQPVTISLTPGRTAPRFRDYAAHLYAPANPAWPRYPAPIEAADLDEYLARKGSPMVGTGSALFEAGWRNNLDPRLLVAISGADTGFGRVLCTDFNAWNWFWWDWCDSPFGSWREGIDEVARGLRVGYLELGLTDIFDIAVKYGPLDDPRDTAGLNRHWPHNVTRYLEEMGGNRCNLAWVPNNRQCGPIRRDYAQVPLTPVAEEEPEEKSDEPVGSAAMDEPTPIATAAPPTPRPTRPPSQLLGVTPVIVVVGPAPAVAEPVVASQSSAAGLSSATSGATSLGIGTLAAGAPLIAIVVGALMRHRPWRRIPNLLSSAAGRRRTRAF
jgi:hypothetical protein